MSNHISHGDTEDTEIVGYMVHSLSDLCAFVRDLLCIPGVPLCHMQMSSLSMSNHISHGDTEDTEIVGYMVHSLSDLCAF
ncbi:MAG TPA: hypothetical protein VI603_06865, partial [Saprospiraceae bacterium]|nr:hypothetical protein [Saprospiraceae bacterium]